MSEPLVVSIPHRLGKEEAVRRLKSGLERTHATFGGKLGLVEQTWSAEHCEFRAGILGQASGAARAGTDRGRRFPNRARPDGAAVAIPVARSGGAEVTLNSALVVSGSTLLFLESHHVILCDRRPRFRLDARAMEGDIFSVADNETFFAGDLHVIERHSLNRHLGQAPRLPAPALRRPARNAVGGAVGTAVRRGTAAT